MVAVLPCFFFCFFFLFVLVRVDISNRILLPCCGRRCLFSCVVEVVVGERGYLLSLLLLCYKLLACVVFPPA